MSIDEGTDDPSLQFHIESFVEKKGNQVVEKMVPPRQNFSVPPNRCEKVVQERAFVVNLTRCLSLTHDV